jgi:hypothetical protein
MRGCTHRAVGDRIERLGDDVENDDIQVFFNSSRLCAKPYEHDDEQRHLYSVDLNPDELEIEIDDRRPEPVEIQFVRELRRIGDYYHQLANRVEERAGV